MALPLVIIDLKLSAGSLVNVITSRLVGSGRYSNAKFSLAKIASLTTWRAVKWRNARLVVHGPTQIVVRSKISSGVLPVGISFQQSSGEGDPDGTLNFPLASRVLRMNSTHYFLSCVDEFQLHGAEGAFVWKVSLVVQNQDGTIGIIDPHIENQD